MKYGSVCSGIEAASVAWEHLGWKASFLSEIEAFPRSVLEHHYPDTPLHGDFKTIQDGMYDPIDLLVGGTPCQSFSVAGLRKGLADPRGNLMLGYGALAQRLRPRWLVWENVPGVLSANGGRDFGTFLAMLGQLGYGFAYRVLDAQYFGVAQRRRRVFVVGYLGDWRRAAAVLFERDSLCGNPAPRREKGKEVAADVGSDAAQPGGAGFRMVAFGEYAEDGTGSTMKARDYKDATDLAVAPAYGMAGNCIGSAPENGGNGIGCQEELSYTLTKTDQHGVAYAFDSLSSNSMKSANPNSGVNRVEVSKTLDTSRGLDPSCNQGGIGIAQNMAVRRLTPTECERLQGFPDGHTLITVPKKNRHGNITRVKPAADGSRYKALGNSMAVPVMRWIGERIQAVENLNI